MEIDIKEVQRQLPELIQLLESGKEDRIVVLMYGKAVAKITKPYSKRIGVAKSEMKEPTITVDELNSIEIDDFNL